MTRALLLVMAFAVGGLAVNAHADGPVLLRKALKAEEDLRGKTSVFERRPDYGSAIALYSRALSAGGLTKAERETALFNRASLYIEQGECKSAIEGLTELLESQTRNAMAYAARGSCALQLGNLDAALDDLTRAIELSPSDPMLRAERAEVHKEKKQYSAAISDLSAAMRLAPTESGDLYVARGDVYSAKGEHERAIGDYRRAIGVKHANAKKLRGAPASNFELAPIYTRLGNAYHALAKASGKK